MKKVFKVLNCILVVLIIISMFSGVYARQTEIKMKVVQKNSESAQFDENHGYICHEIVSCNENTGEVHANLNVNNVLYSENQKEIYDNTEILIMLSENIVLKDEDAEKSKLEDYINYIETLIRKVIDKSSNTKVGIIGVKGTISDTTIDDSGKIVIGENDEGLKEGSSDNAEVIINPTNDVEAIRNAILNMNSTKTAYYINLEAAIHLAKNTYSEETNKILISLYDTVPSISNGVASQVSYGGGTLKEAVENKHKEIVENTKAEILSLKKEFIDLILLRPEDTDFDEHWYNVTTGVKDLDFDGSPYVRELYGTIEKPTYGKMYSLTEESLEEIVTSDIYQDIIEKMDRNITNVVVKNTFSKEILENFDITINTPGVTMQDGVCTWNVGDLAINTTTVLDYTMKIKDMNNANLLDKIINISEGSIITYTNSSNENGKVELKNSPKIQLATIVVEEESDTNQTTPQKPDNGVSPKDNSTAPGTIPQTGLKSIVYILPVAFVIFGIVSYSKYRRYKDI